RGARAVEVVVDQEATHAGSRGRGGAGGNSGGATAVSVAALGRSWVGARGTHFAGRHGTYCLLNVFVGRPGFRDPVDLLRERRHLSARDPFPASNVRRVLPVQRRMSIMFLALVSTSSGRRFPALLILFGICFQFRNPCIVLRRSDRAARTGIATYEEIDVRIRQPCQHDEGDQYTRRSSSNLDERVRAVVQLPGLRPVSGFSTRRQSRPPMRRGGEVL